MKKHIITIAGNLGAGKSSTADRVAAQLGYTRFSSGSLFRTIAAERGLTVGEANKTAESLSEIDEAVDQRLREIGESGSNVVIDSRLAFHWMPHSFKVFLKLDADIAAQRIFQHIQEEGRLSQTAQSVEEVRADIELRTTSECKRYMSLYGIDYTDESLFNLVIDTSRYPLITVADEVVQKYTEWLGND